jgi:phage recombination protein Bet
MEAASTAVAIVPANSNAPTQYHPPAALAAGIEFTAEQRQMIRDTYASGASDAEFSVLMEIAKVRHLNPLLRQIFFVKRWDGDKRREVWAPQVSIDGLRTIAQRTGLYDGQDEPEFAEDQGGKLTFCRVRVYRKDWSRAAVGVAHWGEYAAKKKDGTLTKFWAEKPHIMLAKCAEALALRKAFPEDTAGLYVPEEMGDVVEVQAVEKPAPKTVAPPPAAKALPRASTPVETRSAVVVEAKTEAGHTLRITDAAPSEFELLMGDLDTVVCDEAGIKAWLARKNAAQARNVFSAAELEQLRSAYNARAVDIKKGAR